MRQPMETLFCTNALSSRGTVLSTGCRTPLRLSLVPVVVRLPKPQPPPKIIPHPRQHAWSDKPAVSHPRDKMPLRVNIPPATRIFLVSLLALSFLYNVARWRQLDTSPGSVQSTPIIPYLTLVPSFFYYYPWTLLTATFVEQNIFTVILNGATIFYGGKYLERAWGSREFSKFIVAVTVIPNAVIIPIYLIWGGVGGSPNRAYVPATINPLDSQS